MRLETQRIFVDWFKHATFGINSYIPTVPRDAGDPQPPFIAAWDTDDLAVFDETRHLWVAEKKDPPALPAIYVMGEGSLDVSGEPYPNGEIRVTEAPYVLVVRYITSVRDTVQAIREGEYTLRALLRSTRELMKNVNVDSRTRNGVCVEIMDDPVSYLPVVETVGQSRVSGAVVMNLQIRDGSPSF